MGFTSPTVETVDLSDGTRFWSLRFSRHDPKTGKLLEFDDWSHCIAETKSHQVEDTDRRRVLFDQGQQLKSSSFTPPPHDHNQPRIYQSRLPVLRKDADEFQLHVYHNNHSKIATLDVPFPVGTAASPEWTPNPLPQTASDG
ncbi:MAG: hypothetical protein KDA52_25885, partial [Planctomycetaceae bacterium]|nr:hypothetical protein [Planctomycetaceae bacterium]